MFDATRKALSVTALTVACSVALAGAAFADPARSAREPSEALWSPETRGHAGAILFTPFNLPAGKSITIEFSAQINSPLAAGVIQINNQGTVSATNLTAPVVTDDPAVGGMTDVTVTPLDLKPDLSIAKLDTPDPVVAGNNLTYTVNVTNGGPVGVTAGNVRVVDTLPTGVTYVSGLGTNWTCGEVAGVVTCDLSAALPVGAAPALTITVSVDPGTLGVISNTATVSITGGGASDPVAGNNSAMASTTVTGQGDLAITKTDGVTTVQAGSLVTYTLVASNPGPSDATGATVADTFPGSLTGVSWTCTGAAGSSCTAGPVAGNINDVVTITAGGSVTYTVMATLSGAATGTLVNTATITAPIGFNDPAAGNNSATDVDTITGLADLEITKDNGQTSVLAGGTTTYTITVTNNGPGPVTGATVTDTFVADLTCTWTCVASGGGACTAGPVVGDINDLVNLAAGEQAVYTASCNVSLAAAGTLSNTAAVSVPGGVSDPSAGNNSATDTDTVTTDAVSPQVTGVTSVADTGDGQLSECEHTKVGITQLLVSFNEAMSEAGAGDANDPANYQLLDAGPNGDFDTTGCGLAQGDDVAVTVDSAAYNVGTFTATLAVNGGAALPDALYRLWACSTLTDTPGNALDGDGNAVGGDDFVRTFRVETANLFTNGHMDCDIASWDLSLTDPGEITYSALEDADGSTISGASHVTNLTSRTSFDVTQCVVAPAGAGFDLSGALRVDSTPVSASLLCQFYSAASCTGTLLGTDAVGSVAGDQAGVQGVWQPRSGTVLAPLGSVSGRCGASVFVPSGAAIDAYTDSLVLLPGAGVGLIFADGFESGDTSAWSATVP